jgi:hypothetical protein
MMGANIVPEMSVSTCNQLTRLCAWEEFIEFSRCEASNFIHFLLFLTEKIKCQIGNEGPIQIYQPHLEDFLSSVGYHRVPEAAAMQQVIWFLPIMYMLTGTNAAVSKTFQLAHALLTSEQAHNSTKCLASIEALERSGSKQKQNDISHVQMILF